LGAQREIVGSTPNKASEFGGLIAKRIMTPKALTWCDGASCYAFRTLPVRHTRWLSVRHPSRLLQSRGLTTDKQKAHIMENMLQKKVACRVEGNGRRFSGETVGVHPHPLFFWVDMQRLGRVGRSRSIFLWRLKLIPAGFNCLAPVVVAPNFVDTYRNKTGETQPIYFRCQDSEDY
jgi:hypothetical protein